MAGSVLPQTLVPVGGDSAVLYAKHVRYVHINNLICIHIFYICILHVTNLFNQLSVKLSKLCVDYEICIYYLKPYVHQHVKMADLAQHPDHVTVPLDTQVLPVPMVQFVY